MRGGLLIEFWVTGPVIAGVGLIVVGLGIYLLRMLRGDDWRRERLGAWLVRGVALVMVATGAILAGGGCLLTGFEPG